ncbi:MAG: hypothetical protein M0R51_07335, partial [Clostridia bacterium]|nr:hypothetical protein [Clostridia bacterium]
IIPEKIEVGFNKRQHKHIRGVDGEYFDGPSYLLGYATFRDKGKLRKETSWEGWRDKNIAPQVLDNIPREGFYFSEFDKRSSEWFSSGRTMFRISDPYGFDLEITAANLVALVCNSTIIEGKLVGTCVWAWEGKDLALLATNSALYESATESTRKKNAITIKPTDLLNGDEIEMKNEKIYTYIGKCWGISASHSFSAYRSSAHYTIKDERLHVLMDSNGDYEFFTSLQVITKKPSGKSVISIEEFVDTYNLAKQSYDLKVLKNEPPNYAPNKINMRQSNANYLLSLNKIKVSSVFEEAVNIDEEIVKWKSKCSRGYSTSLYPMISKSRGTFKFVGNGYLNEPYRNSYSWVQSDIEKVSTYVTGKYTLDEKNNKIVINIEKPDRYSYRSEEKTMKESEIRNESWFRYFIEVNGIKYLM